MSHFGMPARASSPSRALRRALCAALALLACPVLAQDAATPGAPVIPEEPPPARTPVPADDPGAPPSPGAAPAPARPRSVRLVASTGYDYAFEDLLLVEYENGSEGRLGANGGYVLAVGAAFLPLAGGRLETRATVGVKYDTVTGKNGSAVFFGFPLEVVEALDVKPLRLSAGLSLLMFPRVEGSGFLGGADLELRNSLGVVGQAEWVLPFRGGTAGSLSVGLRYLWQRLEASTGGRGSDASALGGTVGFTL